MRSAEPNFTQLRGGRGGGGFEFGGEAVLGQKQLNTDRLHLLLLTYWPTL